jgi:hypothetical protein
MQYAESITEVGTETVRRLCAQLVELVGRNEQHRRLAHTGLYVSRCAACIAGRGAEDKVYCEWRHRARIDIAFGLHSGIPRCCIAAYVREVRKGRTGDWALTWAQRIVMLDPRWHYALQYRPCHGCAVAILAGRAPPAKIHKCSERCNGATQPFGVTISRRNGHKQCHYQVHPAGY